LIRHPGFAILALVSLSMTSAVFIHRWVNVDSHAPMNLAASSDFSREISFSSKSLAGNSQVNVIEEISDANMRMSHLTGTNLDPSPEECQCIAEGKGSQGYATETVESCNSNRQYLQKYFDTSFQQREIERAKIQEEGRLLASRKFTPDSEKLKSAIEKVGADAQKSYDDLNYFSQPKPELDAPFSRTCVTYVMKHFFINQKVINDPSFIPTPGKGVYSTCESQDGRPERTQWPPCFTDQYVDLVYNSFVSMMSCAGVKNLKAFLPKFFVESGMSINALGPGFDGGIGQLTADAFPQPDFFNKVKNNIAAAGVSNPVCARLASKVKDFPKMLTTYKASVENRCSLMTMPENPFFNLFIMASKELEDDQSVRNMFNFQSTVKGVPMDLRDMIVASHLVEGVDRNSAEVDTLFDKLKEITKLLSYNMGPRKASLYLRGFFMDRISAGIPVTHSDLSFQDSSDSHPPRMAANLKLIYEALKKNERPPENLDMVNYRLSEYIDIHTINGKSLLDEKHTIIDQIDPRKNRYYNSSPKYLPALADQAKELNRNFKEGACVPDNYLAP